jgi:CelD/BcsL family acetyltransferase involved in cellulose biosynthesis
VSAIEQSARRLDLPLTTLTIATIETLADFEALHAAWRTLHDSDPDASVFISWEWMYHWWKHYGKAHRLRVLVARNAECVVGILPLYVQQQRVFGIPVNMLRFIGTGGDTSPDYLGPLLAPCGMKERATIIDALLTHALDELPDWDVLELSELVEASTLRAQFRAACDVRKISSTEGRAAEMVYVSLPTTWEEYLRGVGQHRRYSIKTNRRKALVNHGANFFVETAPERMESVFNQLMELHRRRWQAKNVSHSFSTPDYVGFHRDVVRACAERDWIRFYGLAVEDRCVASLYCYRWRGQVFDFQAGFDPAYEKMRPGQVLIAYALENAIAEGNTLFDFLRGEHSYKREWGTGARNTYVRTAYRHNPVAALYRLRHDRVPRAKDWLKHHYPRLAKWVRARRGHPESHSADA